MGRGSAAVRRHLDHAAAPRDRHEAAKLRDSGQTEAARQLLSGKRFDVRLRGYDRVQVDAHLETLARQ